MNRPSPAGFALVLLLLASCAPRVTPQGDPPVRTAPVAEAPILTPDQAEARSDCAGLTSPQSGALQPLTATTSQGVVNFQVEIADNDAEREFGLMCRKSLAADRGMLFEFDPPDEVAFWMKDTLIPLDIVFISPDGHVLNVAANARPMDETGLPSRGIAAGVLELAAGRAAQIGLAPGDRIGHPFFTR